MKANDKIWYRWLGALSMIFVAVLIFAGCSSDSAPTASPEASRPLWSPAPGDELAPGRPVPIVSDTYWEDLYGMAVNPWRMPPNGRVPVDELGGTVTLGYHSYIIPPGAIDGQLTFTLAYASLSGIAVDCGPSPCSFDLPVRLSISYRNTDYDREGADPSALQIWYAAEDGTNIPLESHLDPGNRIVWAEVDHFSRYILG